MSDFDCKLCIGREHLTIITVLAITISITITYINYFFVLYYFVSFFIPHTSYVIMCDYHTT